MKSTEAAGQASSAFRNVDEREKAYFPLNFLAFLHLPGIFRVCALKTSNVAVPGKRPTQKDHNEVNVFAEFQHSKTLTDSKNTKQLQKHEKIQEKKVFRHRQHSSTTSSLLHYYRVISYGYPGPTLVVLAS